MAYGLVESYQDQFKQLYNSAGLESYAFCEISSSTVPVIVHFARFLRLFHTVNSAIF